MLAMTAIWSDSLGYCHDLAWPKLPESTFCNELCYIQITSIIVEILHKQCDKLVAARGVP